LFSLAFLFCGAAPQKRNARSRGRDLARGPVPVAPHPPLRPFVTNHFR
jgi:hypothetical protein